jgi:flagellar motor switch protein FliN
MSPVPATTNTADALSYLEQEAAAGWRASLEDAFGSEGCALNAAGEAASTDASVWFACQFTAERIIAAGCGGIAFGLDRATAIVLGHLLLSAKGRASEHDHHALHATNHLVSQFATLLARSVSARLNTPVSAADCSSMTERPGSPHAFELAFPPAYGSGRFLIVCPSVELVSVLSNPSSATAASDLVPSSHTTPRNLELLLDLEMPVSVSFGSTRLALKDVAKLTAGSIVELNRALSEPVDIIVNDCAIARGEVVVVDGNFAVRVNQVMSRQDRLRSLS